MKLLAVDTAADLCAACVLDTERQAETGRAVLALAKGHAEHVMGVVADALKAAGTDFGSLGRIGVAVGPGSFTGLRVGVSAARGFAMALGIPVVGVTTLEAIADEARQAFAGRAVVAVIGNRPEALYVQPFAADGLPAGEPALGTAQDIAREAANARAVLCGNGVRFVAEAAPAGATFDIAGTSATADIATYARLAAARAPGGKPAPLYLRTPDAKPQAGFALPRRAG